MRSPTDDSSVTVLETTRELAERYSAAWNDHDLEALMSMHITDTVFDLHQSGVDEAVGHQAVRQMFDFLIRAWPDQRFETSVSRCGRTSTLASGC